MVAEVRMVRTVLSMGMVMLKLLGAGQRSLPVDRAVHESGNSAHLMRLAPGGSDENSFCLSSLSTSTLSLCNSCSLLEFSPDQFSPDDDCNNG